MIGNKGFVVIPIATALTVLGAASAAAGEHNDRGRERGYVVPCSLAGVNPAYHPEIFGNPAAARADRVWRVESNCRR